VALSGHAGDGAGAWVWPGNDLGAFGGEADSVSWSVVRTVGFR